VSFIRKIRANAKLLEKKKQKGGKSFVFFFFQNKRNQRTKPNKTNKKHKEFQWQNRITRMPSNFL